MNKLLLSLAVCAMSQTTHAFASKPSHLKEYRFLQQAEEGLRGAVSHAGKPLIGATVYLKELNLFSLTDVQGIFRFEQIPKGEYTLSVQYTGMQPKEVKARGGENVGVVLQQNSIAIDDIQVVGQVSDVKGATSTYISRQAIEHMQATHLGEILQLLPGQAILNPSFNDVVSPSIRQISNVDERGVNVEGRNVASMGTAIVVNGAQLSNNANLQSANMASGGVLAGFSTAAGMGTDLRQLTADNIESVEVIRGIPSVEYGDLTGGIIDVKTKASVEPLQAKFRLNPTVRQAWLGQGFKVGDEGGALFVDVDYTHAANQQIQETESYQRVNSSLQYTQSFGASKELFTNTTFAFGGYFDNSTIDPDLIDLQQLARAENYDFRLSTNGRWNLNKRFARNISYVVSGQYGSQQGYQQGLNTNNAAAAATAMDNSTREVSYLPSNYLEQLWIEGKPLSVQARLSNNFYFSTGSWKHGIMVGGQYNVDKNFGRGKSFDHAYPPSNLSGLGYRPRAFSDIPAMQQLAFFIEDRLTASLFDRELQVVAGLRYDNIQPFRTDYKSALSPRVNLSYELFSGFKLRGGYGWSAKAPSLAYLYPENAYFDVFSLNHYKENPNESLALMTTRVFNTENPELKIAKSRKSEVGLDYRFRSNKRVSLTYYDEYTQNGYDMYQYYDFTTIPIYTVVSQEPDEKPVLGSEVQDSLYVIDYNRPTNNVNITNRGFEFDIDFGRIDAIRTSFTLNGAYLYTKRQDNSPMLYARRVTTEPYNRLGVFEARGREYERLVSTIRAIHHIPEIRLIVSLTAQTVWMDKDRYLHYQSRPYGVINMVEGGDGQVIPLSESEMAAIPESSGIYLSIADTYFREDSWKPLWLFNMKLTKEFGKHYGFSFYVNNITNHRPLQAGTRNPTEFRKRNIPVFFGSELTIKF